MTEDRAIGSVAELAVGDAIYAEASHSSYWVVWIADGRVVLEDRKGSKHTWCRETLQASFDAHTWIRQSGGPPVAGSGSA